MQIIYLLGLFFLVACTNTQDLTKSKSKEKEITYASGEQPCVKGKVFDENGDPLIGANVVLYEGEQLLTGYATDIDGNFRICHDRAGTFDLRITAIGYETYKEEVTLKPNVYTIFNKKLVLKEEQIELLKPIIYLYPQDTTTVNVQVACQGGLTHTYPKYPKTGWTVEACPNGTLYDKKGRSYYGLYWEGLGLDNFTINEGQVVEGKETISFLEESLATLGLNEREANEFIVYWLPVLERNPYNLIHFSTQEYESMASLNISPKPDVLIRVMMVYEPLAAPINIPQQNLKKLYQSRQGFTVVEWGGARNKPTLAKRN